MNLYIIIDTKTINAIIQKKENKYQFKLKKKNLFSKMNPSQNFMNYLVLEIQKKQQIQIKKNINNFINVIHIFYEFRSTKRKYNDIINELFLKAFMYGMIYYNNSVKALNKSQEKIKSLKNLF